MLIPLTHSAIYQAIRPEIKAIFLNDCLHVLECIDSTQAHIKLIDSDYSSLVVAESQTEGKGRFSRDWSSSGQNVLMSCSWKYDFTPDYLGALGLALIVELAEILRDDYDLPVTIKWPNDLLIGGKKAAGILVDVVSGSSCCLYVGLGLNVQKNKTSNSVYIDQPWADMATFGAINVDRNKLIANLYSRWSELFLGYPISGFSIYQERWNALSEHLGKNIELSKAGKLLHQGVMRGVDEQGFLLIKEGSKVIKIMDSECSLRAF